MENTIRSRETAGFTVLALAALIAPAVAFLISYFVGFYNGIPAPRPAYTPPDIATYIMDAAARFIFGISLYLTVRAAVETQTDRAIKGIAVGLWIGSYALSMIWLPVFFTLGSYIGGFIILALIGAMTTVQFIINLKISFPAAIAVLPYWAFVLFYAWINLMMIV